MNLEQEIEKFKSEVILDATYACERGYETPSCALLISHNGLIFQQNIPIEMWFRNNSGKSILFNSIFPEIFSNIDKQGAEVICIAFSSEAWLWVFDKDKPIPKDRSNLPKEEVLMITFESKDWAIGYNYSIVRDNGNIKTELKQEIKDDDDSSNSLTGRMGNLLRKYNKSKNEHENTDS